MLNRLLNTFEEEEKATGIELLKSVLKDQNAPESVRDWTSEFLDEQTEQKTYLNEKHKLECSGKKLKIWNLETNLKN